MSAQFLPRRKPYSRYGSTWIILRGGQLLRSRADYLLGTYHRLLQNVSIRDECHNSDHYLVQSFLLGAPSVEHLRCLRNKIQTPLRLLTSTGGVYCLFVDLQGAIPKLPRQGWHRQSWILLKTWRLINTRIAEHRHKDGEQRSLHLLRCQIKERIQVDCRQGVAKAGSTV